MCLLAPRWRGRNKNRIWSFQGQSRFRKKTFGWGVCVGSWVLCCVLIIFFPPCLQELFHTEMKQITYLWLAAQLVSIWPLRKLRKLCLPLLKTLVRLVPANVSVNMDKIYWAHRRKLINLNGPLGNAPHYFRKSVVTAAVKWIFLDEAAHWFSTDNRMLHITK